MKNYCIWVKDHFVSVMRKSERKFLVFYRCLRISFIKSIIFQKYVFTVSSRVGIDEINIFKFLHPFILVFILNLNKAGHKFFLAGVICALNTNTLGVV